MTKVTVASASAPAKQHGQRMIRGRERDRHDHERQAGAAAQPAETPLRGIAEVSVSECSLLACPESCLPIDRVAISARSSRNDAC
jgi:hypothetical protein